MYHTFPNCKSNIHGYCINTPNIESVTILDLKHATFRQMFIRPNWFVSAKSLRQMPEKEGVTEGGEKERKEKSWVGKGGIFSPGFS